MQLLQVKWLVPLWVGALVLSACGEGSTATTSSVFNLDGTAYQTLPPTVSTLPPTTLPGGPVTGQVTTDATTSTIQAGDVPVIVAARFDATLDPLPPANADTEGWSSFYVGLVIKIPAGATIPDITTSVSYTHLRAHETVLDLVCRLLLEKKKNLHNIN